MQAGTLLKAEGDVEPDETFVGSLAKIMHAHKREKIKGTGGAGNPSSSRHGWSCGLTPMGTQRP